MFARAELGDENVSCAANYLLIHLKDSDGPENYGDIYPDDDEFREVFYDLDENEDVRKYFDAAANLLQELGILTITRDENLPADDTSSYSIELTTAGSKWVKVSELHFSSDPSRKTRVQGWIPEMIEDSRGGHHQYIPGWVAAREIKSACLGCARHLQQKAMKSEQKANELRKEADDLLLLGTQFDEIHNNGTKITQTVTDHFISALICGDWSQFRREINQFLSDRGGHVDKVLELLHLKAGDWFDAFKKLLE